MKINPKFTGKLMSLANEAISFDIVRVSFPFVLEYEKCNANILGAPRVSFSVEADKKVCISTKPFDEESETYRLMTMKAEFSEPFVAVYEDKHDVRVTVYVDNPSLTDSKSLINHVKEIINWEFRQKELIPPKLIEGYKMPKP